MTTIIKSTESGRIYTAELMTPSGDALPEIMEGSGIEISRDDGAPFEVPTDEEAEWWVHWAETEELIGDARENADDAMKAKDDELIDEFDGDFETLQWHECELFGIEYKL
jgi:hypothetical protein